MKTGKALVDALSGYQHFLNNDCYLLGARCCALRWKRDVEQSKSKENRNIAWGTLF